MKRILEYPTVKQIDEDSWVLVDDYVYAVGSRNSDDIIFIQSGFTTDFASIPKILWNILPPFGKYSPAALIHDFLYFTQKRPRKEADKIFLEAMEVMGVNWITRRTMYSAVRTWGWIGWNRRKKEKDAQNKA